MEMRTFPHCLLTSTTPQVSLSKDVWVKRVQIRDSTRKPSALYRMWVFTWEVTELSVSNIRTEPIASFHVYQKTAEAESRRISSRRTCWTADLTVKQLSDPMFALLYENRKSSIKKMWGQKGHIFFQRLNQVCNLCITDWRLPPDSQRNMQPGIFVNFGVAGSLKGAL